MASFMRPDAAEIIERQIQYHRERTQTLGIAQSYQRNLVEIDEYLSMTASIPLNKTGFVDRILNLSEMRWRVGPPKGRDYPFIQVVLLLDRLASWYASSGIVALASGDTTGWEQIHLACLYQLWHMRFVVARSQEILTRAPISGEALTEHYHAYVLASGNVMALCLCFGWYHSLNGFARPIGDHLVKAVDAGKPNQISSLVFFACWLHSQITQSSKEYSESNLGRYYPIVNRWNGTGLLDDIYSRACEYHCRRVKDVRSDPTYFGHHPFDVVPYEILLPLKVRQGQGMPLPANTHPLLLSVFADPPHDLPTDGVIERFSLSFFRRFGQKP